MLENTLRIAPLQWLSVRLRAISPVYVLLALMLLYAVVLFGAMAYKHSYWGQGFDQVDYEQAIWNTTQGRFLGVSRYAFTDTFLGLDVALGFLVAVPFYALWPSAHTLMALQTLFLVLGAVPVYLIARDRFNNRWAGVAWAAAYLLYPTLQFVNMTPPFQARVVGILGLLWAFYFFQRERLGPFLLLLLLAMMARSDVALIAVAFGLYALLSRRDWRWFAPPLLGGLVWFYLAISVISPSFYYKDFTPATGQAVIDTNEDIYNETWPGTSAQIGYYAHLGDSLPDIVINILTHPVEVVQLMFAPEKLVYLFLMFGTLLFLPLLAPKELLLCAPIFAINLLSTRTAQIVITEQYQALIIPGIVIAGIYGAAWLWEWLKHRSPRPAQRAAMPGSRFADSTSPAPVQRYAPLLLLALVLLVGLLNIPVKNPVVSALRNPERPERVAVMERMAALIPPDARVAATSFLAPHLLPRQYLYYLPGGTMHVQVDQAEYAFIDTRARVLEGSGLLERLRSDPDWQVIAEENDLVLFKQTTAP